MTRQAPLRYLSELRDLVHDGRWARALVGAASSPLGMGYVLRQPQQPTVEEAPLYVALRDALIRPEHVYRLPLDQHPLWSELGHQLWQGLSGQADVDPEALMHTCQRWWGAGRKAALATALWWAGKEAVDLDVEHRPPGGLGETQEEQDARDAANNATASRVATALSAATHEAWAEVDDPLEPGGGGVVSTGRMEVHPFILAIATHNKARTSFRMHPFGDTEAGWYSALAPDDRVGRLAPPQDPHLTTYVDRLPSPAAYLLCAAHLLYPYLLHMRPPHTPYTSILDELRQMERRQ